MEGEWSCYGQLKGGRMVMLQSVTSMEGERSCQRVRGGQFNGGRNVMEVASLKKGEWLL